MEYSGNQNETELNALKRQVSELRKENDELLRSLQKVNEKLQDSERLKGHFISNITNEIVNPFSSVLALAENIRHLNESEIGVAHRLADLIYEEAFHLDFQLKNIFAAAMIEAGNEKLLISQINFSDIKKQYSSYFSSQLRKKKIELTVSLTNEVVADSPIQFVSDRDKIDMIIKNLISNSIKFSPENSEVNLDLILGNGTLSIEVSDHGKGIHPDDRRIIFDRFKQLDERINSINTGHGLGLSIVQAYTDLLGGKISLHDNYQGGIRILVTIPESIEVEDWDDLEDFLLDNEIRY